MNYALGQVSYGDLSEAGVAHIYIYVYMPALRQTFVSFIIESGPGTSELRDWGILGRRMPRFLEGEGEGGNERERIRSERSTCSEVSKLACRLASALGY